jgi:hypothetical protein
MPMPLPSFDVEFDKRGQVIDPAQVGAVVDAVSGLTDLIVISHGWNDNIAEARALYDRFFDSVDTLQAQDLVAGLGGRSCGQLRIFWPSKKFEDSELIPGGGAAGMTAASDLALLDLLEKLKNDPQRLGVPGAPADDPAREAAVARAQELVPSLEQDAGARQEFVTELRSILNPGDAHPEDGSKEFFELDPEELFQAWEEGVVAPVATPRGGAAVIGGTGEGAVGLRELVSGVKAAARRIANYTTYYEMKERAGIVGRVGLSPVLRQIRRKNPGLKLHLVGHSFGGRLVTAAANALDAGTPKVTLALLQAAYSHNGLASRFDGTHDGLFRKVLSEKRASGPILITHTKNDRAVGIGYPLASRIARVKASIFGDENDPYGGMGRNGAQHTAEAQGNAGDLLPVGGDYTFAAGKVYNLRADEFIKSHSDVTGFQVVYAVLTSVGAS